MRAVAALLALLLLCLPAAAEEALEKIDLGALEGFAGKYAPEVDVGDVARDLLAGEADIQALLDGLTERAREPLREVLAFGAGMLPAVLLLAVTGCTLKGGGARFLLRLTLIAGLLEAAIPALTAAGDCIRTAAEFSDAAAPALTALMAAAGMTNSAALLSPASAMAGNIAQNLFLSKGIPLCRAALCAACAGGFSAGMDLSRLTKFLKKITAWGVGLSFTLFTALIALQGNVTASLDGVAVRTAKYAVDSASAVIGSGVSDAWESYLAGALAARSAVGVSGMAALALSGLPNLLRSAGTMLLLQGAAVLLDVLGEKAAARTADQVAGVCQMALTLMTGAMAISMILLGAVMFAGRGLLG